MKREKILLNTLMFLIVFAFGYSSAKYMDYSVYNAYKKYPLERVKLGVEFKPQDVDNASEVLASTAIQNLQCKQVELVSLGDFTLTAYCDCEDCQGPWVGITALGTSPTSNYTIAVDPDIIPLGSTVIINGKEYCAEDTGSAIIGNKIDIFVNSHDECFEEEYNQTVEVYLKKEG